VAAGTSAKRYAQAAFQLALEGDSLDQWAEDLAQASDGIANEAFRTFLQHAKVPYLRKIDVISQVLSTISPLVRNLLALLISRGLIDRVPAVERQYRRLLDQHRGRVQVEATSAVVLEDAQRLRITQLLERLIRTEVVLATQVDPAILGGLVLRIEDRLMDGSARTRLNDLRRSMAGVQR